MSGEKIREIILNYSERVYNIALRITCNAEDAEDVVQETFLTVYRKYEEFEGRSDIFTWIYRIAVNQSLHRKAKVDKNSFLTMEEDIINLSEMLPSEVRNWKSNPEDEFLINELTAQISRECTYFMTFKLSLEQRLVFILRTILDFSYKQIAEILEIPESSVKARLYRARNNLIGYFSSQCQYLDPLNTCSCQSRIGYAVSLVPQILDRVRKHAGKDADHCIRSALEKIPEANSAFRDLPYFDFNVKRFIDSFETPE